MIESIAVLGKPNVALAGLESAMLIVRVPSPSALSMTVTMKFVLVWPGTSVSVPLAVT